MDLIISLACLIGGVVVLALLPGCRLAPWVYRTSYGKRFYARIGEQRLYRGGSYLLWRPAHQVIPGLLWYASGQDFYLDDFDFTPVWRLGRGHA